MRPIIGPTENRPRPERETSLPIRLYGIFTTCCLALFSPLMPLARRHPRLGTGLDERLGRIPVSDPRKAGERLVWIHAASMGEVQAAFNLITVLQTHDGQPHVLLTVTSAQGWRYARQRGGSAIQVRMAPLDTPAIVDRVIQATRPDLFVCVETELWPALLHRLRQAGITMLLVNGRLSARSARAYRLIRGVMTEVLSGFSALSVISETDRERFTSLGVVPDRIRVHGNSKYGGPLPDRERIRQQYRTALGLDREPVFISGSTRGGEEEMLIPAFAALGAHHAGARWILAPRHLRRLDEVEARLNRHGLEVSRFSRCLDNRNPARVILVDRMGLLAELYAAADYHFCGGSLVDKGGHNIMEVIRWGMPVYFGPHITDFQDAADLVLEAGAGFQVENGADLAHLLREHIRSPERHHRAQEAATDLAATLGRATEEQARMIREHLDRMDPVCKTENQRAQEG